MKTIDSIPTGKIVRAAKLVKTGVKLGGNYLKYYGEKIINPDTNKDKLNEANAEDIYDTLKDLKGSALKAAQMLSMEKNILPRAYVEKFSLAQFSVPPLSGPLVRKTFKANFGQYPEDVFDSFSPQSVNAASIGQVHKATKNGQQLAVKIQYPGVAESISSDLALVKPIALRMFNMKSVDADKYFVELESKLKEETDYQLELKQSQEIAEACAAIPNLLFPNYYEKWSTAKILTMDRMEGLHLSEFAAQNKSQELANKIGQALWDFYFYQIHVLRKVQADPHPGNFLVSLQNQLVAIDFGCMKTIPADFYYPYFELADIDNMQNPKQFERILRDLEMLKKEDSPEEISFFAELFHEMLSLFTQPLNAEIFDFADPQFFSKIAELGEKFTKNTELRKLSGNRGSKHFLYMNRTFFGLFSLMHDLKAQVVVNNYKQYAPKTALEPSYH